MPDSFNATHPRAFIRKYLLDMYGAKDTDYKFIISEITSPTIVNVKYYLNERQQFRKIGLQLQEDKTFEVISDEADKSYQ